MSKKIGFLFVFHFIYALCLWAQIPAIQINRYYERAFAPLRPVNIGEKWGYIDLKGNLVVDPIYDEAYDFIEGLARVKLSGKWSYVKQPVVVTKSTLGFGFGPGGMIEIRTDGKVKSREIEGSPVFDSKVVLDRAGSLDFNQEIFQKLVDKLSIGKNKELKILKLKKKNCEEIFDFTEEMARVKVEGKWGFINTNGEIKIDCKYDSAYNFSDDWACVMIKDKWGFIDKEGEIQVPFQLDEPSICSGGMAKILYDGKWGYIRGYLKNKIEITPDYYVIEPQFDDAGNFINQVARVKKVDKWGYINKRGEFVFEPKYDYAGDLMGVVKKEKGDTLYFLARVKVDNKWGYIDNKGSMVKELEFNDARDFFIDHALVKVNDKWGYIDSETLKFIIEPQFDDAGYFHNGRALVKKNGKWGYIDTKGRIVIEPQFERAEDFFNGLAKVELTNEWGYISINGNFIWKSSDQKK